MASTTLSPDGEPAFAMMVPIDDKLRDKAMRTLDSLANDCKTLALNASAEMVARVRSTLERDAHRDNVQWLLDQMKTVRDVMSTEMKWRVYAYIPEEKAKYFSTGTPQLFGEEVYKAFPDARNDVHEAGCCMALTRPTAAVFHLMRVLECGLVALGKTFSISLAHTNWGSAIDQIESRIRDMHKDALWKVRPDCKDLQVKYAQAAATFGVLKDAWRNHTMHSRVAYDEEEAEHGAVVDVAFELLALDRVEHQVGDVGAVVLLERDAGLEQTIASIARALHRALDHQFALVGVDDLKRTG